MDLKGKKAIILGVANNRSLAWGIAQKLHEFGCELGFSYLNEKLERRVRPLADNLNAKLIEPLDTNCDDQAESFFKKVSVQFGSVDILIHSIAFADKNDLEGQFLDTSRDGFALAMNTSVYSFIMASRLVKPLMKDGGSIITLSYLGSKKVVPNYNVMGVCKSALESSVRYLAYDMGPSGIRVNAVSAGPVKTLSASGVKNFKTMLNSNAENVPLRSNIDASDVGMACVYLACAPKVTGEVLYVDSGAHIL